MTMSNKYFHSAVSATSPGPMHRSVVVAPIGMMAYTVKVRKRAAPENAVKRFEGVVDGARKKN
jgi:hypothetical protein